MSSDIEQCLRGDLPDLAYAGVRLLTPDSELSTEVDAPWFDRALRAFRTEVGHAEYPCYFGRRALEQRALFVTRAEVMNVQPLADALSVFLDYVRPTPRRRQVLAAFVDVPGTNTHEGQGEAFWNILQGLHDSDDRPWPEEFPLSPEDPGWEFCFHGTAMFVFSAAPTHLLRRSRNLGDVLVLLFQPRNVFWGIEGGTPAGTVARRRIRERLRSWDAAEAHPAMGDFGDPANFEWRQYVIPDDGSDMYQTCPFRPHTGAETTDRNQGRAGEDETRMHDTEFDLPELPDPRDANAIIKAFAANAAYRAAQQHELTTEGNPSAGRSGPTTSPGWTTARPYPCTTSSNSAACWATACYATSTTLTCCICLRPRTRPRPKTARPSTPPATGYTRRSPDRFWSGICSPSWPVNASPCPPPS